MTFTKQCYNASTLNNTPNPIMNKQFYAQNIKFHSLTPGKFNSFNYHPRYLWHGYAQCIAANINSRCVKFRNIRHIVFQYFFFMDSLNIWLTFKVIYFSWHITVLQVSIYN